MSRGIDFKTVNSVINFDFPTSLVSYIHRVGRTARAGRAGLVINFITKRDLLLMTKVDGVGAKNRRS